MTCTTLPCTAGLSALNFTRANFHVNKPTVYSKFVQGLHNLHQGRATSYSDNPTVNKNIVQVL